MVLVVECPQEESCYNNNDKIKECVGVGAGEYQGTHLNRLLLRTVTSD